MKYSTAITLFLACGPAAILAAPVAHDAATPALTLRSDGGASGSPQAGPQTGPPQGSSATGQQAQKSGNEGVLDKVEKIIKDVLGGLRKRGVVEEVGDALKKTLDGTSKLVNGEQSGSQSGFSAQSSNPDAQTTHPQPEQKDKDKEHDNDEDKKDDSGDGSSIGKILHGRDNNIVDPVNDAISSASNQVGSLPKNVPAPAPVRRSRVTSGNDGGDDEHHHPSASPSIGPNATQQSGFPSSASDLTPEQLAGIISILNNGGAQKKSGIPDEGDN